MPRFQNSSVQSQNANAAAGHDLQRRFCVYGLSDGLPREESFSQRVIVQLWPHIRSISIYPFQQFSDFILRQIALYSISISRNPRDVFFIMDTAKFQGGHMSNLESRSPVVRVSHFILQVFKVEYCPFLLVRFNVVQRRFCVESARTIISVSSSQDSRQPPVSH